MTTSLKTLSDRKNDSDLERAQIHLAFEHNVPDYELRYVRRASKIQSGLLVGIARRHRELNVRLNPSQTTDDEYVDHCNCRDSIFSNEKGPRAEEFASRLLEEFPPGWADTLSSPTVPEVDMK